MVICMEFLDGEGFGDIYFISIRAEEKNILVVNIFFEHVFYSLEEV